MAITSEYASRMTEYLSHIDLSSIGVTLRSEALDSRQPEIYCMESSDALSLDRTNALLGEYRDDDVLIQALIMFRDERMFSSSRSSWWRVPTLRITASPLRYADELSLCEERVSVSSSSRGVRLRSRHVWMAGMGIMHEREIMSRSLMDISSQDELNEVVLDAVSDRVRALRHLIDGVDMQRRH